MQQAAASKYGRDDARSVGVRCLLESIGCFREEYSGVGLSYYRRTPWKLPGTETLSCCFGAMLSFGFFGRFHFIALFAFLEEVWAVCPHCGGSFSSCTWASDSKCPTVTVPMDNATVIAAGTGVLTLAALIKPRFLRMMSSVSFDTILALIKRAAPGTAFTFDATTSAPTLIAAIANGRTTWDVVLMRLCELYEGASDSATADKIKNRMDCIKTAADIKAKTDSPAFNGLFDTGILTFIFAKVSTFVMQKGMQIKLHVGGGSGGSGSSDLTANLSRPDTMEQFAEMMNLFLLFVHNLAVVSATVVIDFFEHVVYDTIRMRNESWQLAFELMLVMFRRVEDSGGSVTLAGAYDESHLNTVMDEAKSNLVFFRTHGGSPGNVKPNKKEEGGKTLKWNNKFTATATSTCTAYNTGSEHRADMLMPDGTCKHNHVCDQWVSNKGRKGKCLCSEGTPNHKRSACDNPHKCDKPVA
jgi:hypothetical protein